MREYSFKWFYPFLLFLHATGWGTRTSATSWHRRWMNSWHAILSINQVLLEGGNQGINSLFQNWNLVQQMSQTHVIEIIRHREQSVRIADLARIVLIFNRTSRALNTRGSAVETNISISATSALSLATLTAKSSRTW